MKKPTAANPAKPAELDRDAVFSDRTLWIMGSLGAVSLAAMLYVMATGDTGRGTPTHEPSSFSASALGYRGACEFFERSGFQVRSRRSKRVVEYDARTAVVVAEPKLTLGGSRPKNGPIADDLLGGQAEPDDAEDFEELLSAAQDGRVKLVVILPKWSGSMRPMRAGLWTENVTVRKKSDSLAVLKKLCENPTDNWIVRPQVGTSSRTYEAGGRKLELIAGQFLRPTSGELEPTLAAPAGALIARVGDRNSTCYVVSDPDLLNNHGLVRADNAATMLDFFQKELGVRTVLFDEVCHGFAAETPFLAELMRFPLVLTILHGMALAGLAFWAGAVRLGKPNPYPPRLPMGKAGLIENTAQLMSHRGRLAASAKAYFDEAAHEVAEHYHIDRGMRRPELAQALQAASDRRKLDVDVLGLALTLAGRERNSTAAVLQAARELHQWRERMLDGR